MSNLFHFFLLQSDGVKRVSVERKPTEPKEKQEDTPGPEEVSIAKTKLSEQVIDSPALLSRTWAVVNYVERLVEGS